MNLYFKYLENKLAIDLVLVVVFSVVIFKIMMYAQRLKEEEADRKYKAFMKSRGLSTEVENERNG